MAELNIKGLVGEVVARGINLADTPEDWTDIAFAFANEYREGGRQLFHAVAAISDKYKYAENEKKYSNALRTVKRVGIGTFIYMCQQAGIETKKYYNNDPTQQKIIIPKVVSQQNPQKITQGFDAIPVEYVERSLSVWGGLMNYLCKYFDTHVLDRVIEDYFHGATKNGADIFWQVDTSWRVRTGKIIKYGTDGHRLHDFGVKWVHTLLVEAGQKAGRFGKEFHYNLAQCLFGEHLLKKYEEKPACIVESEKTAMICACLYPQYNWLSCGGVGNFKADRLQILKGRKVIVYPDTDTTGETFAKWKESAAGMTFAKFIVSDFCERNANDEQRTAKADIADILLAGMQPIAGDVSAAQQQDDKVIERPLTAAEMTLQSMIQDNPAIGTLIDKLNLKIVA